jgi:hypothetical protein
MIELSMTCDSENTHSLFKLQRRTSMLLSETRLHELAGYYLSDARG